MRSPDLAVTRAEPCGRRRHGVRSSGGLELVDALTSERSLKGYNLLRSVRGELLARLGRFDEAREEYEQAARLTRNARERELFLERAAGCARRSAPTP